MKIRHFDSNYKFSLKILFRIATNSSCDFKCLKAGTFVWSFVTIKTNRCGEVRDQDFRLLSFCQFIDSSIFRVNLPGYHDWREAHAFKHLIIWPVLDNSPPAMQHPWWSLHQVHHSPTFQIIFLQHVAIHLPNEDPYYLPNLQMLKQKVYGWEMKFILVYAWLPQQSKNNARKTKTFKCVHIP